MLLLPLPNRPDWRHPPIVVLALITVFCTVFFGFQSRDAAREVEALATYKHSPLPALELPAYTQDLQRRGKASRAKELMDAADVMPAQIINAMESDADFMRRLRAGQIVTPDMPAYSNWRSNRRDYEALRARIFSERFSLDLTQPTPKTLLSYMFLHGGVKQLAGTLLVLVLIGYAVEATLGSVAFLALFLLGGVGACVPSILLAGDAGGRVLGPTGAMAAVAAAYLMLFATRRIRFAYWFVIFYGTVRLPAFLILAVWAGNEVLQDYVFARPPQALPMLLGGFATGALLALLHRWRHGGHATPVERLEGEALVAELREQAAQHLAAGRFARAAEAYRQLVKAEPADDRAVEDYLRAASRSADTALIGRAASRLLWRTGRVDSWIAPAAITQALQEMEKAGLGLPTLSMRAWERIARRLIEGGELASAEKLVLRLVPRDGEGRIAPALLFRLERALREAGRPREALQAQQVLEKCYPEAGARYARS